MTPNRDLWSEPCTGRACSRARALAEDIQRLEESLSFIDDELVAELAIALICMAEAEAASRAELEDVLGPETGEVVLLGFIWRLFLPSAPAGGSLAWEDARAPLEATAKLRLPSIVGHLVGLARRSGSWRPDQVLPQSSYLLPEEPERLASLMVRITEYAPGGVISANQLGAALHETGLECSLDTLIAHWKGAGVISPRLSSVRSVADHRSPLYEINPSVFIRLGACGRGP